MVKPVKGYIWKGGVDLPKRDKPLVESIESIRACQKYGGAWLKNSKVCLEKDRDCTAPFKGIRFCWTEWQDRNAHSNWYPEMWWELAATGDTVHKYYPRDDASICHRWDIAHSVSRSAVFQMMDVIKEEIKKEDPDKMRSGLICCNPFGKIISCKRPDAIITDGHNIDLIAHLYNRDVFKHKGLREFFDDYSPGVARDYVERTSEGKTIQSEFERGFGGDIWLKTKKPGRIERVKL